jgi:hypothetical protein
VEKGPKTDATDASQALRLFGQPYDEGDDIFDLFKVLEHRWNEIDRGKPKYSGKTLSQWHFVHHKSHID